MRGCNLATDAFVMRGFADQHGGCKITIGMMVTVSVSQLGEEIRKQLSTQHRVEGKIKVIVVKLYSFLSIMLGSSEPRQQSSIVRHVGQAGGT